MKTSTSSHDVIIIGSGPAGYTAGLYCARAGLAPVVLEGSIMGGALMTTTEVENFPGFRDGIVGPVLMEEMRAQSERFGALLISADATSVELGGDSSRVADSDGAIRTARAVILAMGSEYRKLGLTGEDRLSGHGVSWCATCDGPFFKGKEVAVVGGGDSAMEEALFLARFASAVTVIHRRGDLRASWIMAERAHAEPKIRFLMDSTVTGLHGEKGLTAVTVNDLRSGTESHLGVDGLFVAIGHTPRSALVHGQVEVDRNGYVLVESPSTRTSIRGVFACGDLVDDHYRQAITAAGTGCAAALDAQRYLASHSHPAGLALAVN
jgi:thioredoxin reductase (NADPH)